MAVEATSPPLKHSFSGFSGFIKRFTSTPFKALDGLDLSFHGFQFNVLRSDRNLLHKIFYCPFLISLVAWLLLGADSTVDQVAWVLQEIVKGNWGIQHLAETYVKYYGLGTHWSAPVIYSAQLMGLSKHFRDKFGIVDSVNLSVSGGFVALTIAVFEFTWLGSYAFYQNQPWVLSLCLPQMNIVLRYLLYLFTGILVVFGLNRKVYGFNFFNIKTLFLLLTSTVLILLWWNYGLLFPVQTLTVGNWASSPNFPQTMYTVDMDLTDGLAVGEMFYVPNEGVHLVNNLAKISQGLFFYSLFKIRLRDKVE